MLEKKLSAAPTPAENSLPYLGQTPPGNTALVFAAGVVSKGNAHGQLVISPDGKELFWTTFMLTPEGGIARIMYMADENGKWTDPHTPPFLSKDMTSGCVFSPDGKKLFFNSTPDIEQGWKTKVVEKTASGWGEPRGDGLMLSTSSSFTRSGLVYFSAGMKDKPWNSGIFCANYSDTGPTGIQALDAAINSPYIDYTPFISPEGDYLMFSSSRPSAQEDMFLHISFKTSAGAWSAPQKMNEKIGFSGPARFPSISPDGKYIFFCADDGNFYWLDRRVVDQFKP